MSLPNEILPVGLLSRGVGYQIQRSLRFNSADSAYLSRTPGSAGNRKTWTWAGWVKRCRTGGDSDVLFSAYSGSINQDLYITFVNASTSSGPTDAIALFSPPAGNNVAVVSNAIYRDHSAWYHIVAACDTTQGTAANRVKIYVNGTEVTYNVTTYPSQDQDLNVNNTQPHALGSRPSGVSAFFSGYLADIHFIDGQALDPSSFGEFDTNGVWQPIAYTGSYGTNGFHLPFSDNSTAAALGTDTSGNGNDWTVNNIVAYEQNYSRYYTAASVFRSGYGPEKAFNNLTGYTNSAAPDNEVSPYTVEWIFPTPIPFTTLEHSYDPNTKGVLYINDVAQTTDTNSSFTYRSATGAIGNQLEKIKLVGDAAGPSTVYLSGIKVDGTVLVDGNPANTDSLVDSPTNYGTDTGAGNEVRGNYCTWNPLQNGGTLANGNLDFANLASNNKAVYGTIGVSSGKWYFEVVMDNVGNKDCFIGIAKASGVNTSSYVGANADSWGYISTNGYKYNNASGASYGASYTNGDVIGVALDIDAGTLVFYKNGSSQGTAFSGLTAGTYFPAVSCYNSSLVANFGQRPFAYPVSGFKALCTTNLPTPTILDGSDYMDVALYTGNSSTQTISGLNFSPDFVWLKKRSGVADHYLYDTIRGATYRLYSNTTDAESTSATGLTAFTSTGFELGSANDVNQSSNTYAAWTWDAGSSTVTNTQGTITSQVRANASAGFSVATFTASGTAGSDSCGHGLNVMPGMVIIKSRTTVDDWYVWHSSFSNLQRNYLPLNSSAAVTLSGNDSWGAGMTSTVIGFRSQGTAAGDMVAYCFAPVAGYSSFGSYTGNGSVNGSFVYTGFRPKWILVKSTSIVGQWGLWDATRNTFNVTDTRIIANLSNAELTNPAVAIDLLSNGFKLRNGDSDSNQSSATYIYAAFAEHPFATSRAR